MKAGRKTRAAAATLGDLGEDRVVEMLTRKLRKGGDVLVAAGDDCAVIGRARDKRWQLLKTDVVIEGIHFRADEDPRRVGWKALCRSLSDIAAMGGVPAHALITLAAAASTPMARVQAIYAGLEKAARRFGASIVGGETARSPGPLFLNVALTGWVERKSCVLRSGGKPGDVLYVTGRLGGSIAGRHLDFHPRLAEARWLVAQGKPHAMMDLSDGLAADLPRLAAASGCGFVIEEDSLPCAKGCSPAAALEDGEDYEMLFAAPARRTAELEAAWKRKFPRLPLTRIGRLTHCGSSRQETASRGYDHFAQR